MVEVNAKNAELIEILGLPPGATTYAISSAIRNLRDVIDMRELQDAKDNLDRLMKKILERMPEKAAAQKS